MRHTITERSKEQHDSASLDALRTVSALAGCDDVELARIDDLGTEVRRAAGTVLQRPGSLLRQAFVVLDGVVTEQPPAGRESVAGAGHGVGFEAMGGRITHAPSKVVALTDVRVLVFGPLELADASAIVASHRAEPIPAPARRRSAQRVPASTWLPAPSAIA